MGEETALRRYIASQAQALMQMKALPEAFDCLAPDGSEIRLLSETKRGSSVHCTLPPGKVSLAVAHRTVEEIWYFLEGQGQVWRKREGREVVVDVARGVSLTVPLGTHFQFRNSGEVPLRFVITTMPPWPGEHEAYRVDGHWPSQEPRGAS